MNKKRIILFTHFFPNKKSTVGAFNYARAKALIARGHKVIVISPICLTPPGNFLFPIPRLLKIINYITQNAKMPKIDLIDNIKVYYPKWFLLPKILFWRYETFFLYLFIKRTITNIFKDYNPEVIITTHIHPEGSYAKYFKRLIKDAPVLSIAEGSEMLLRPLKYKGIHSIINVINKYCTKIIFVSEQMFDIVTKKYIIKNAVVINNGYNNDLFYYDPFIKRKNNTFKIITVGYFVYEKGHDLLLKALKEIDNIHLTIIGSGILESEYKDFITRNDLIGKVTIHGFIKQDLLAPYLQNADLFCFPSRSESFGIAAIEAMACGLPVVGTSVGELPNIIKNGVNGYLCEMESVESLKQKIIQSMNTNWDNTLIAQTVMKKYSWEKWVKEVEKLWSNKI